MSDGFATRKKTILVALNSNTPDKSPKGYVDEPLLPLIILINNHQDYVTTSSCSGRICTYLEGLDESQQATRAKGGQWLYVSHDPVVFPSQQKDSNDQHWIVEMLFGPEAHRVVLMEDK
ncbi:methyltransferase TYW3-domain-containing protein [Dissophora ornata]|nr:methyltransferase TYW3-domain-containing protein [Dissophora ornata]